MVGRTVNDINRPQMPARHPVAIRHAIAGVNQDVTVGHTTSCVFPVDIADADNLRLSHSNWPLKEETTQIVSCRACAIPSAKD